LYSAILTERVEVYFSCFNLFSVYIIVISLSSLYLQWPTNRKSRMIYRTAPLTTPDQYFKLTPLLVTMDEGLTHT